MTPETLHGLASAIAAAVAALSMGAALGPETCVPIGAVVLLAIASPRDIWAIARQTAGVSED